MSDLPPPHPPLPYASGHGYADQQIRLPGSIKSLSIVAIVLASLFLLCNAGGLASSATMLATGGKNPMAPNAPVMNQLAVHAFGVADSFIKLALAGVLLAGGIGGLRLSRWARGAMIWWSLAAMLWATIALVLQVVWLVPATANYMMQVQSQMNPRMPQNISGFFKASQIGSAVISWLFWCALPACFLILWRSPRVVEVFDGSREQLPPQDPHL